MRGPGRGVVDGAVLLERSLVAVQPSAIAVSDTRRLVFRCGLNGVRLSDAAVSLQSECHHPCSSSAGRAALQKPRHGHHQAPQVQSAHHIMMFYCRAPLHQHRLVREQTHFRTNNLLMHGCSCMSELHQFTRARACAQVHAPRPWPVTSDKRAARRGAI